MSEPIKDGGPAFPLLEDKFELGKTRERPPNFGMTLRDWFAGRALSASDWVILADKDFTRLAAESYALADAMIAERQKGDVA